MEPRTHATFDATGFNTSVPKPTYVNPTNYGDDVAQRLDEAAAELPETEAPDWLCFVERRRSLRTLFAGAAEKQVTVDAAFAVHAALSSMPEVSRLAWHRRERFERGDESDGSRTPS